MVSGFQIRVRGIVQGVGFRPFVWQLAQQAQLSGSVLNDSEGVLIELQCSAAEKDSFIRNLRAQCPPLSRISGIECQPLACEKTDQFRIVASSSGHVRTGIAPDAATCADCLTELMDPTDRRYRYPFINCTNCGPRLSIVEGIPYDRANTSMRAFKQCASCQTEYDDPADRRFHAQPNACADCGPELWLESPAGERIEPVGELFSWLTQQLKAGQILAIKGLGGFHLACDGSNADAVEKLRQRKFRPAKPFALMVRDLGVLAHFGKRTEETDQLLQSPAAPIVLMDRVEEGGLPEILAPGQYQLGFMLPATPLHHLLLEQFDVPLVMTSGNRSGQPQAISNEDAREQLAEIADLLVLHNRDIVNRLDDSVARQTRTGLQVLRRARGYAPEPLLLPPGFDQAPDLLALGGELKNTLCLLQGRQAILSQHLGDLEDAQTYEAWEQCIALYRDVYQHQPQQLVRDQHPEYLSSKYAVALQEQTAIPVTSVQHHHAHLASCLGEHRYPLDGAPVLGICFDGTGFGDDNTLWGGELLLADYRGYRRLASLPQVPLIGGSQAIREPWRNLFAQLERAVPEGDWRDCWPQLTAKPLPTLRVMVERGLNSPLTSSAGRLFDAVGAALGCSFDRISYEGQAAIELEAWAMQCSVDVDGYLFALIEQDRQYRIDPAPMWQMLVSDLKRKRPKAEIAAAFHNGLVEAVLKLVARLAEAYRFTHVALSGGVMQNQLLQQGLVDGLKAKGLTPLTQSTLPANDGGLSFGQALIAAAQWLDQQETTA